MVKEYLIPKRIGYLHNHTQYSVQDGVPELIQYKNKIIEMQQEGVDVVGFAVTDHGVAAGIVDLYENFHNDKVCKAKPLYGVELYTCNDRATADDKERHHLVVIAKSDESLKNYYSLCSIAGMNPVGQRKLMPRAELNDLKKYGKGLIGLSACIGGEIPQLILNGEIQKAIDKAIEFSNIFDEFYLEVQPNEMPEQLLVNKTLVDISNQTGIPLVITTDTHYLNKEDKKFHDVLLKINYLKPFDCSNELKSFDEIYDYCIKYNIPLSAITNTVKISEECNVDPSCKDSKGMLPKFPCPKGYNEDTYLRKICFDNLFKQCIKSKFKDLRYRINRLNYELDVVISQGFSGYFLILWEWFDWCKKEGILLGKGRGKLLPPVKVI